MGWVSEECYQIQTFFKKNYSSPGITPVRSIPRVPVLCTRLQDDQTDVIWLNVQKQLFTNYNIWPHHQHVQSDFIHRLCENICVNTLHSWSAMCIFCVQQFLSFVLCRSVSDTSQTNGASQKLAVNNSSQARASHTETPHPVWKAPTLHNLPSDYMGLPCFITADSKTFPTPLLTRKSVRLCRDVSTQFPDRQERVHRQNRRLLGVLVKALISTDQRLAKCRQDNLILRGIIEQSTLRIDSSVNSIGSLKAKLEDRRRVRPLWFHCTLYVCILFFLSSSYKLHFWFELDASMESDLIGLHITVLLALYSVRGQDASQNFAKVSIFHHCSAMVQREEQPGSVQRSMNRFRPDRSEYEVNAVPSAHLYSGRNSYCAKRNALDSTHARGFKKVELVC